MLQSPRQAPDAGFSQAADNAPIKAAWARKNALMFLPESAPRGLVPLVRRRSAVYHLLGMINGFALAQPFCASNRVNRWGWVSFWSRRYGGCRSQGFRGRYGDRLHAMGSINRYIFRTTFGA